MEPSPGRGQTGVSELPPAQGTCGLLRAARGTSCSRSLCDLPLGPPAHRAAILLTWCLHFVVGPSLSPACAARLLARCLPSGSAGEARRAASRVAWRDPLAVPLLRALPAPLRLVGSSGTRRSGVSTFATATGLPRRLSAQRAGAFHKCWGTSSGLSWIIRLVCDSFIFFRFPCLWPNERARCALGT